MSSERANEQLGVDERIVVARVASGVSGRLRQGARDYGALSLVGYGRDALAEAREEMLDGAVYLEIALIQRDEERQRHAAEIDALRAELEETKAKLASAEAWARTLELMDGC